MPQVDISRNRSYQCHDEIVTIIRFILYMSCHFLFALSADNTIRPPTQRERESTMAGTVKRALVIDISHSTA